MCNPIRTVKCLLFVLSFVALSGAGAAAQNPGEQPPAAGAPASADTPAPVPAARRPLLKYAAPKSAGSVGARVDGDGGSRGTGAKDSAVYLLVPDGEALTTRKQPSLFFFQRGGEANSNSSLILTLLDPGSAVPLLKAKAEHPEPGFRRVQLARHSVELRPGVRYEWRVALGVEGEGRSADSFASGVIRYVEPSPELTKALEASPANRAEIYAGYGIWYDAFEEVSNRILEEPVSREWKQARAALLKQVGLGRILEKETGR